MYQNVYHFMFWVSLTCTWCCHWQRWSSQLRSPTTRRSSPSKWWGVDPRSSLLNSPWCNPQKEDLDSVYPTKSRLDLAFSIFWWGLLDFSSREMLNICQIFFFFSKVQFWRKSSQDASRHLFLHHQRQDIEGQGQVTKADCGVARRCLNKKRCWIDWYRLF